MNQNKELNFYRGLLICLLHIDELKKVSVAQIKSGIQLLILEEFHSWMEDDILISGRLVSPL